MRTHTLIQNTLATSETRTHCYFVMQMPEKSPNALVNSKECLNADKGRCEIDVVRSGLWC